MGSRELTLEEVIAFLNASRTRATYGAVAELLAIPPIGLGARIGERRAEASWIVSAKSGLPTGYDDDDRHPALLASPEIIRTSDELLLRLRAWRRKKR